MWHSYVGPSCVQTLPAPGLMSPDNTLPLARPRSAHQGLTCCPEHVDKRTHNGTDSHIPGEVPWRGAPPSQAACHEMREDRPHKLSTLGSHRLVPRLRTQGYRKEGTRADWCCGPLAWPLIPAHRLHTRCHLPRVPVLALTQVSKGGRGCPEMPHFLPAVPNPQKLTLVHLGILCGERAPQSLPLAGKSDSEAAGPPTNKRGDILGGVRRCAGHLARGGDQCRGRGRSGAAVRRAVASGIMAVGTFTARVSEGERGKGTQSALGDKAQASGL